MSAWIVVIGIVVGVILGVGAGMALMLWAIFASFDDWISRR